MEDNLNSNQGGFFRNYAFGIGAVILIIASFATGTYLGRIQGEKKVSTQGTLLNRDAVPPYQLKDVDFTQFWDVWKTVRARYVRAPATDVKMFYGAISGMVTSLGDPYSVFFDPEVAAKFNQELSGTFSGIGAEVGMKKGQLIIIAPLPKTPADNAGIKAGDKILLINGNDTSTMTIDEAVSQIRGQKGTVVKLMIFRDGFKEPKEFPITRDTIVVEAVKFSTVNSNGKKIAIITLSQFNEVADAKFNDIIRKVILQNPDGVVLDMRNNPGGFLETAVKVAGEWITKGSNVVVEKSSDGTVKNHPSTGAARLAKMPTVVLVNGGSASASEIVAGALQDYGKAKLVGEKTFGKGSVQDFMEFDDGSALKLTIALWYTPKDRSIDKEGIAPDEVVKRTIDDVEANKDPQLDRAIGILSGK